MYHHLTHVANAAPRVVIEQPHSKPSERIARMRKQFPLRDEYREVKETFRRVSQVRPSTDTRPPQTYHLAAQVSRSQRPRRADLNAMVEHGINIANLQRRIESIGTTTERKKNPYDPTVNPSYLMRRDVDVNYMYQIPPKLRSERIRRLILGEADERPGTTLSTHRSRPGSAASTLVPRSAQHGGPGYATSTPRPPSGPRARPDPRAASSASQRRETMQTLAAIEADMDMRAMTDYPGLPEGPMGSGYLQPLEGDEGYEGPLGLDPGALLPPVDVLPIAETPDPRGAGSPRSARVRQAPGSARSHREAPAPPELPPAPASARYHRPTSPHGRHPAATRPSTTAVAPPHSARGGGAAGAPRPGRPYSEQAVPARPRAPPAGSGAGAVPPMGLGLPSDGARASAGSGSSEPPSTALRVRQFKQHLVDEIVTRRIYTDEDLGLFFACAVEEGEDLGLPRDLCLAVVRDLQQELSPPSAPPTPPHPTAAPAAGPPRGSDPYQYDDEFEGAAADDDYLQKITYTAQSR
ncbi:hypothetical protein PAPYR_1985 [Paratrimastix pyriformis]|uniref:Uncharacterized protein n=1 Tax=Paratrimastix pyriformis TaxID=342808 RepID=A0ABQ8UVM2_9EUKA|nr:hypothetical protein PAPYR_1985 [Paratrimastix pyriformis]